MADAELLPVPHEHPKSTARRAAEVLVSLVVVVALFVEVLPRVTGASWSETGEVLERLGPTDLLLMTALWLVNMASYTWVLTSALPGLGHPQALTVNLAGSAVSNTVPFGGAVGVGATYGMCMSWGFAPAAITLSILVTGFWNVFAKLGLPAAALVLLLLMGEATGGEGLAALIGLVLLGATLLVFALVLKSDRLAHKIGHVAEKVGSVVLRLLRRPPMASLESRVVEFRDASADLVRRKWVPLTVWMVIYNVLQFGLLMLSLRLLGGTDTGLGFAEVFAAFAFARLLGVIPLTPSGAGFVEVGLAGALKTFGADPALAAAATVLFSVFTYWIEIPMGAIGWVVWSTKMSWRRAQVAPPGPTSEPTPAT